MRPIGNTAFADNTDAEITFRVAQANHKSGAFDSATESFYYQPI